MKAKDFGELWGEVIHWCNGLLLMIMIKHMLSRTKHMILMD